MLQVGEVIGGRLRVDRLLGAGGMGVVAAATHLELQHVVAIKMLRTELATDPTIVERFLREARAVAGLRTEHVCRMFDVGRDDAGTPYIVMELLQGSDVASMIAKKPLPVSTAVDFVIQACVALAEAHAAGIVHRDLKPSNIFVTRRANGGPLVKVLDFGIAKAAAELRLTLSGSMLGSPGYMSPEQLMTPREVDARTDIWSLGVSLYQMMSGTMPFPSKQLAETALMVTTAEPRPLDVDRALRAVIWRCLEKARENRFADVAAFANALVPFGGPSARNYAALVGTPAAPHIMTASMASTGPIVHHAATAASVAVAGNAPTAASIAVAQAHPHVAGNAPTAASIAVAQAHPHAAAQAHPHAAAPAHPHAAAQAHPHAAGQAHPQAAAPAHPNAAEAHPHAVAQAHPHAAAQAQHAGPGQSSKRSRAVLWIPIGIVLLGGAVAAGYFARGSGEGRAPPRDAGAIAIASIDGAAHSPIEAKLDAAGVDGDPWAVESKPLPVDAAVAAARIDAKLAEPDETKVPPNAIDFLNDPNLRTQYKQAMKQLDDYLATADASSVPQVLATGVTLACFLRDKEKAKKYLAKLTDNTYRTQALQACIAYNVSLDP